MARTKKKSSNKDNMFFLTFIGEYVEVLANTAMPTKEDGAIPLTLQGYLLDMDEEYYYFGETPGHFNSVIKRQDVSFISIIEKKDAAIQLLETIPRPSDEKEFN